MSDWPDTPRPRRDVVTIPFIWLALVVSLLVHVGVLFLPGPKPPKLDVSQPQRGGNARGPINVTLAPREVQTAQVTPPSPQTQPAPPRKSGSSRPNTRSPTPSSPPPDVALNTQVPVEPLPLPPTPPHAPGEGSDMSSFIEARRRARGESSEAPEDDNARANRIIASNLEGTGSQGELVRDQNKGGGIFEIDHVGFDYAEFKFFGWNRDMGRSTPQYIEVRRGENKDVRIAMVRKMIDIIRDKQTGDFTWVSQRLGHDVTLSARVEDDKALQAFLMKEFFDQEGSAR